MPDSSLQSVTQAFILCAGLGTRMKPLTNQLPKPLIPLFQEPMVAWSMERYRQSGVTDFIINTHHLAGKWPHFFPEGTWRGCRVRFSHEPVLLDTGGGLRQIRDMVDRNKPLLIHNGDILTTIDHDAVIRRHAESGAMVTMALRSCGDLCNVGFDSETGLVTDMRHNLGVSEGTHEFAGIYVVDPTVIDLIPDGPVSIVPTLVDLIGRRQVAGIVLDEGVWFNVGNPSIYLDMHRQLIDLFPDGDFCSVHDTARIAPSAHIDRHTVVGARANVGEHCRLEGCVVWPGVHVSDRTIASNRVFS